MSAAGWAVTADEYEAELARQRAFTLRVAEHLADASEVLGHLAEKRKGKRMCYLCQADIDRESPPCPVCGEEPAESVEELYQEHGGEG